jgi:spermidine synthase
VIPRIQLAAAKVPGEAGTLRLMRRGAEFSVMLGPIELMNSRRTRSEEALATVACRAIRERPGASVLVGGLGMGFTLRAVLGELSADAIVTVAELVPEIVAWARGPMAELFGGCLDDPRVRVRVEDVGVTIRSHPAAFDAILLDVDNGPAGLTRPANDRLYHGRGLAEAQRALRPGGLLAVWASARDDAFSQRLRRAGFAVKVVPVRSGGTRNVITMATRA